MVMQNTSKSSSTPWGLVPSSVYLVPSMPLRPPVRSRKTLFQLSDSLPQHCLEVVCRSPDGVPTSRFCVCEVLKTAIGWLLSPGLGCDGRFRICLARVGSSLMNRLIFHASDRSGIVLVTHCSITQYRCTPCLANPQHSDGMPDPRWPVKYDTPQTSMQQNLSGTG